MLRAGNVVLLLPFFVTSSAWLVDLPALAPEQAVSWLATALETADAALLVVDLGEPRCVE